ncbi:hypothetical protein HMPREF9080_01620 [Cardiobacterium valvarum F0432]|uniref:Uncharacterized protein n=1 Tax=Cardiobacterium valvarum F0432 TaxID=797473 RepID=G9ZFQ7_9GAMM|nr:hypothetical protein HMPREF9080_01620 [Cardiobacterium valvarum F0432]
MAVSTLRKTAKRDKKAGPCQARKCSRIPIPVKHAQLIIYNLLKKVIL